jgi:1,4-dihydroxy-2-naphthoyl-CoA hydrolase
MRTLRTRCMDRVFVGPLSWRAMTSHEPWRSDRGFEQRYGLVIIELGDGHASGRVEVRDELKQPAGLIHGGVYAAIAESLATAGTNRAVAGQGNVAAGFSTQTSFLRPITAGTIHASARARHRGRTTWVWEVEIADDAGRVCVLTRATVTVHPAPHRTSETDAPQ